MCSFLFDSDGNFILWKFFLFLFLSRVAFGAVLPRIGTTIDLIDAKSDEERSCSILCGASLRHRLNLNPWVDSLKYTNFHLRGFSIFLPAQKESERLGKIGNEVLQTIEQ